MRSHHIASLAALAMGIIAGGCSSSPPSETTAATSPGSLPPLTAMADLTPTAGNTVRGTVVLTQEAGGVHVVADLAGLSPGEHGFHIQESGDCSATDAASAENHFNPTGAMHGGPDTQSRHAGDLGNLTADASGNARYDHVDPNLTLEGDRSVIGHTIVVHVGADDLASQPAGNAGPRTACGIIVRVENGG